MPDTDRGALEADFHAAMESIYDEALKACDYRATRFLQMVRANGGLAAARTLLGSNELSDGLTSLWECSRLDLSMEALVLGEKWAPLFSQADLDSARSRLSELGYSP